MPKTPSPFPTREKILEFIQEGPRDISKREIARAFGLNAEQKRTLKKVLRDMALDGSLRKGRGKRFGSTNKLPEVAMVKITRVDEDARLYAVPMNWKNEAPPPQIIMQPDHRQRPALGKGDRALVRLSQTNYGYRAKTIRRIASAPYQFLGIFIDKPDGLRIHSTNRRDRSEFIVETNDSGKAQSGELVRAEVLPGKYLGLRYARVLETFEHIEDQQKFSLIAIHHHDIPHIFPPEVEAQSKKAGPAAISGREDLRNTPLITIDGADARDFDDAVWAEPDPERKGGWHCIVAIADVASYVKANSALDIEAQKRGNSIYFPDQVIPMLPEALSNNWCSLKPDEDRPCLAAHLWINADGIVLSHRFTRGLMRSAARLTYEQVQSARDGNPDSRTKPLLNNVIEPLYGIYQSLAKARTKRSSLELSLPEYQIILDQDGHVKDIQERLRLDSHKLIEELMVTANVAAAETLERQKLPCLYRIHDQPSGEKIEYLTKFLTSLKLRFSKGQVINPIQFNQILAKTQGSPLLEMVSEAILRAQAQAGYDLENIGHFGLGLRKYCHFTSPIRRYADLIVHRLLIDCLQLGVGGDAPDQETLGNIGKHVSETERRASTAERESNDRYTAQHMKNHVGETFVARVSGVTRAGLFITLEATGADGLVPIRSLPDDYYEHDSILHTLTGRNTGLKYYLGQNLDVLLIETVPITGGMIFNILDTGVGYPSKASKKRKRVVRNSRARVK